MALTVIEQCDLIALLMLQQRPKAQFYVLVQDMGLLIENNSDL